MKSAGKNNGWEACFRLAGRILFFVSVALLYAPLCAQEQNTPGRLLTVWSGMLPIILAAPHGGRTAIPGMPVRRGIGVAQFSAERDNNTAELAATIAMKIEKLLGAKPFLIISHFERKYLDANRPETGAFESAVAKPYYEAYHRALEAAVARIQSRWEHGLLLDVHGQGAQPDAIFRGTANGKSVAALQERHGKAALSGPQSILGQLASKGYRIVPNAASGERERRYTGGYTTQTYGSHRGTGIDAIQLELGGNLRSRRNLERTAADFAHAIVVFAKEYLPS